MGICVTNDSTCTGSPASRARSAVIDARVRAYNEERLKSARRAAASHAKQFAAKAVTLTPDSNPGFESPVQLNAGRPRLAGNGQIPAFKLGGSWLRRSIAGLRKSINKKKPAAE